MLKRKKKTKSKLEYNIRHIQYYVGINKKNHNNMPLLILVSSILATSRISSHLCEGVGGGVARPSFSSLFEIGVVNSSFLLERPGKYWQGVVRPRLLVSIRGVIGEGMRVFNSGLVDFFNLIGPTYWNTGFFNMRFPETFSMRPIDINTLAIS